MGITFSAVCLKCGVEAPEVGDFGYIGLPVANPEKSRGALQGFGFIYAGFAAVGAFSEELEAFKAFLDEHGAHPIRQYFDSGEQDFGNDEEIDEPPRRIKRFRFKKRGFVEAFHELYCENCKTSYSSGSSERLRKFDSIPLTPERIDLFLTNVAQVDEVNFHKVGGFPFDDIHHIAAFLRKHKKHHPVARMSKGEPSKKTPGLRKRGVEAWKPPEWLPENHENALGRPKTEEEWSLLMALRHREPSRRREAAQALGKTGNTAFLGHIVSLLHDPETTVRAAAVQAFGTLQLWNK
jgi:hypothetical protein